MLVLLLPPVPPPPPPPQVFAFDRTVSRLLEMQSVAYLTEAQPLADNTGRRALTLAMEHQVRGVDQRERTGAEHEG